MTEGRIVETALPSPAASSRAAWRTSDLASSLAAVAGENADRVALVVDGSTWTYGELSARARRLASLLLEERRRLGGAALGAVMGSRTGASFVGILAALFSGAAYVPLNPKFPPARNAQMLRASGARTLVIESADLALLVPFLGDVPPLAIFVADAGSVLELEAMLAPHRVFGTTALAGAPAIAVPQAAADALAYVMFTSGSTGAPKGVMVTQRNVMACLASFGDRYSITAEDRFSQNFDLTFDLSVFDMFLCWLHGASLYVPSPSQRACPAPLVASAALTIWFSVPSMGLFMEKMRALKPNAFPALRWSLFCGERLPVHVAERWAAAAPASTVENLYGPTELTIACTVHTFGSPDVASAAERNGSVEIGLPLPGMCAALVDDTLSLAAADEPGELCLAGPQVAAGYLDAPRITAERFLVMPWDTEGRLWYRTGDLARRVETGGFLHLGRADDQIKIRGYRVELGEIEFAIRKVLHTEAVAAIAVTGLQDVVEIVTFIATDHLDDQALRASLEEVLPSYMHPAHIVRLDELPLNRNGKVDKTELTRKYTERHARA